MSELTHLISTQDLNLKQIESILTLAKRFQHNPPAQLLSNKIIAHCFCEPSTRTRLSFESAALRMNARTIGFQSDANTSMKKGESLQDTIKTIAYYADLIILRHSKEGAAQLAQTVSCKPIINAGDGANQHPTQALIDLFTLQQTHRLSGLALGLVGDLKYSRTIHSLVYLCVHFNMRLFLVSPDLLRLPKTICDALHAQHIVFSYHESIAEIIGNVDALYMTRWQQERFSDDASQLNSINKAPYQLKLSLLTTARPCLKILHPLPRYDEIECTVDQTPYAAYFDQVANSIPVRQAILALLCRPQHDYD